MDRDRITSVVLAALLHDVGKLLERGEGSFSRGRIFTGTQVPPGHGHSGIITSHNRKGMGLP